MCGFSSNFCNGLKIILKIQFPIIFFRMNNLRDEIIVHINLFHLGALFVIKPSTVDYFKVFLIKKGILESFLMEGGINFQHPPKMRDNYGIITYKYSNLAIST